MKFGIFNELQCPRPWDEGSERRLLEEVLEQIELADRLGIDYTWQVEHHFLEEYSHSSAPEVFLAAASQRTKDIRLGHGIVAVPPAYNHPARVAERLATLDVLSKGRVEFGTGETSSDMELGGFNIERADKRAMWEEVVPEIARMMAQDPYPGFEGKYFSMPPRNVVPKPLQRPHPPMWVACSKRETILMAGNRGLGALSFSFINPDEARTWVNEYYEQFEACTEPAPLVPNPNIAVVTGFMCCEDEQEAIDKGLDGFHFFAYSIAHYYQFGQHRPGRSDIWSEFEKNREEMGFHRVTASGEQDLSAKEEFLEGYTTLRGAIGTPEQLRRFMRCYEEAGVDQVILITQGGRNRHEDICEALELFAREVMPEFQERDERLQKEKATRLAPAVERITELATVDRNPELDYVVHPAGVL